MWSRIKMRHELKCWPIYFWPLEKGIKTFEYRKNDRDFQVGDQLVIKEYETEILGGPEGTQIIQSARYTGKILLFEITYILSNALNIPDGWCILGLKGC